jgi:hypothetical protein
MEPEVSPPSSLPFASRRWLLTGSLAYLLLGGLDWFLTLRLVEGGLAYEANPLAAAVLADWGWIGLAAFKCTFVGLFLGVGMVVWQRRPRTGRVLLGFGCAVSCVVVGYSSTLLLCPEQESTRPLPGNAHQARYYERLTCLAQDIAQGKRTLQQATSEMEAFLREVPYDPMPILKGLYRMDRTRCLAAHLVRLVGMEVVDNPRQARRQLNRLTRQFATFQAPLPERSRETFFYQTFATERDG